MSTIIQGSSWCAKCDVFSVFELTGYNEPCQCHNGLGKWWEVKDAGYCECGEPKKWMHQPPPEPLEFAFTLTLDIGQRVYSS